MDYAGHVEQLSTQYQALRTAAAEVGPAQPIPTCPEWTVETLIAHLGRVYGWVPGLIEAQQQPELPEAPDGWAKLLSWTDEALTELVRTLRVTDPGTAAWGFTQNATVAFWARRMAHETAIHRLDAEHAAAGNTEPLPGLIFDPAFAADGIDELLAVLVPVPHPAKNTIPTDGTLLVHAADAGQAWQLTLTPGAAPTCHPAQGAATEVDATMAGTADAVYRAIWGRPHTAVRTGNAELFDAIPTP